MSRLTAFDKQVLEKLFQMSSGYVLNFSDRTLGEFFRDELGVNIYDNKYNYGSGSKANRIRGFWLTEDDVKVSMLIIKLIEHIDNSVLLGGLNQADFPDQLINKGKEIAKNLIVSSNGESIDVSVPASVKDNQIAITLNKEVFRHVRVLLNNGHYFNAVEESYKIVREKLKSITGKEKAHEAFAKENFENIFGHEPTNEAESDFFEGVKFLHFAIQNLRNEKAHTPAKEIDKNLAIHYIVLASLAYDLINRI